MTFIGFGALAESFATGLSHAEDVELRVWLREGSSVAGGRRLDRISSLGVSHHAALEDALRDADVVVAAVPMSASRDVATQCVPSLAEGCLYLDPAPSPPRLKAELSETIRAAGASYVDLAVLGTVLAHGIAVPSLASGDGAARWVELAGPLGFDVRCVDGPAGRATLVKLLRSVYMRGRDALILEALVAARSYGLEATLLETIGGPAEAVPFAELAERVLTSLAVYSERRADELDASAEVLAEAGVEPLVVSGAAARLRWLAETGLKQRVGSERPDGIEQFFRHLESSGGR